MDRSVLEAIFASMEQGVVFIDDRSRIAYCNPAAERIRNVRLEEVRGQSILECHPSKSHSRVLQVIDDLRSGRVKGHHRMNVQLVEGRFYDNVYSAVRGPQNEFLGVIVVSQEVTERKRMEDELKTALEQIQRVNEDLRRADRMKDDFLSNVSHELKTPMISVMGYMGMVLREKGGPLNEAQKKFLDISYRNLLKLGKMIDNLLDLAEFGVLKDTWTFDRVDLGKTIEFSCATVEPFAKEHEIQLEIDLPEAPVIIVAVEEKLNQLLDNLLTNAIKYNRQRGKIWVSLSQDAESAYVRISDTGVGIAPHSLQEVFKRHFQEQKKSLGDMRGLGIGLSLVQEIVKFHNGRIHLESEMGKGSTFSVLLPKNPEGQKESRGQGSG